MTDDFIDEIDALVAQIGVLVGAELDGMKRTALVSGDDAPLKLIGGYCDDICDQLDSYAALCSDIEHGTNFRPGESIDVPIPGMGVYDFRSGRLRDDQDRGGA